MPPPSPPRRKDKGGISFSSTAPSPKIDLEAAKAVCAEYRINNADILCTEDYEIDDLVDVIEGSRVYIPCIYAVRRGEEEAEMSSRGAGSTSYAYTR